MLARLLADPVLCLFGPGADSLDFVIGDAEEFEKALVVIGVEPFEIAVPLMEVFVGEAGGSEELDPGLAVHDVDLFEEAAVAEQLDDDALAIAEGFDLGGELGELALEGGGEILMGLVEEFADVGEGQAGLAVEADLAEACGVLGGVAAVAVGKARGGFQEAEAIVVEEGGTGESVLAGEGGDGHDAWLRGGCLLGLV